MESSPGNPIIALAAAMIHAFLYILRAVRAIVAFLTITVPTWVVRILGYTLTLQLDFTSLVVLFFLLGVGVSLWVRYRVLNKYSDLKEPPLAPPDSHLLNPDLTLPPFNFASSHSTLHNYLDEFLAAIRIFGFLEKPVFHELSRHLQTKRLIAGETISLDAEDREGFVCVVDGSVQVFARSGMSGGGNGYGPNHPGASTNRTGMGPRNRTSHGNSTSNGASPESPYNGYQLLNEVDTGGTVSSLFTILRLFTEDVKLSWEGEPEPEAGGVGEGMGRGDEYYEGNGFGKEGGSDDGSNIGMGGFGTSESYEDVKREGYQRSQGEISQLDLMEKLQEEHEEYEQQEEEGEGEGEGGKSPVLVGTGDEEVRGKTYGQPIPNGQARTAPGTPRSKFQASQRQRQQQQQQQQQFQHHEQQQQHHAHNHNRYRSQSRRASPGDRPTVIARATVDTTLAVIPFEAFTRLRQKFPKATGQIVSVILERFARVTFMTAHKYLGLTREILQAEDQLNTLVSYPLPPAFYEQGGMRNLRERFQPELRTSPRPRKSSGASTVENKIKGADSRSADEKDYFTFSPEVAMGEGKAPSLPATTPKASLASKFTPIRGNTGRLSAMRQDTYQKRSANRKQVGAGDLFSMTSTRPDEDEAYYRPQARTPGFNRTDTWQAKTPGAGRAGLATPMAKRSGGRQYNEPATDRLQTEFDLKEAVMTSIAESIGLIHAPNTDQGLPSATDSVAMSTPNSPLLFGQRTGYPGATGSARSPFGGLSMLDITRSNASTPGGHAGEEEASNVGTNPDGTLGNVADLENDVQILYFKAGSVLVKEGEANAGLFFVIDGFLDVMMTSTAEADADFRMEAGPQGEQELLFEIKPGGIAGYLAALSSSVSYTTIKAKTDCYVGLLPHRSFERLLERRPIVLLTLAKRLTSVLSPLVHHLDLALDWTQASAGQVLYREGDKSDSFYFVITGRLRSLNDSESGEVKIVAEHGQNSIIGELEAITGSKRSHTVHAIRESELVRMPMALFNAISTQHPATTIRFLRLIASRVRKASEPAKNRGAESKANATSTNMNLKTVCVMPTTKNVPIAAFAERLRVALEDIGAPTAYLDQATAIRQLGKHAFTKMGKLKVAGWLGEKERKHRLVLYVVDTPVTSSWTVTSIKQADFILLVGMGDEPALGEYEKLLLASGTTARKEMVLLHPERYVAPGSTRRWLKERPFITAHHHVELPGVIVPNKGAPFVHDPAAVVAFKHLREKVETRIKKYRFRPSERPRRPPHLNDFARLARRLCGKSIGLVLGGGGGRGISHLGMIQAMEEMQIPVDAIGGCSIGSFIGGLYAREGDLLSTTGRTKQFSGRMSSLWRILSDLTYPFASYTTGHEFNRGIYKAFYDLHIEDMWIPYFCNSTNITHSRLEIHRTGYAWRYVRASMTLAGLLPPLSDRGSLLVDGGYFSNLPVAEMISELGAVDIIAVDVGSIGDTSLRHYGDSVSGWAVLFSRLNPFSKRSVLSMTEVNGRLAYVASAATLEEAKKTPGCLYYAMPVQQFETLGGFSKFDEVFSVGLKAGREILSQWKEEGRLPTGLVDDVQAKSQAVKRGTRLRRMSI